MEAREALDKILMPKSVAVVGASTDPFKWGNMLLAALQKTGFASHDRRGSHDPPLILDLMQRIEPLFHGLR